MLQCEVCGQKIFGKPQTVKIEGAKLLVCSTCAHFGTPVAEPPKPKTARKASILAKPAMPPLTTAHPQIAPEIESSLELVENYNTLIRQGREKLGLSHEELGKKISEKVSLLKKIEAGKMVPNHKLALRLEHVLKVKLLAPPTEPKTQSKIATAPPARQALTLGDLITVKKKENKTTEEQTERKQ